MGGSAGGAEDIPHLIFQDAKFQVQGVMCLSYLPLGLKDLNSN